MPKIIILNNDLDVGGIQKSLIDFLKYLITNEDYEVHLILWQREGMLVDAIPSSVNIHFYDYPCKFKDVLNAKNIFLKGNLLIDYIKFNFYFRIIKKPWLFFPIIKQCFDVAISYSQNGYPLFYTIDNISAQKKYLWYHHGSYESSGYLHKLNKIYYQKFDKLITVSHINKDMLIGHFENLRDKFLVIPNIINVNEIITNSNEKIDDFTFKDKEFNFVTVSRFSKEKGIDLAIEIASELKTKGLSFNWNFIGEGDLFLEIKKLIVDRNLENECYLLGSKINPYPYMKNADLYIQTSYVESQSITICEALALNKIIVTTDLPVLNHVLQNGKLGVLCNLDASSFADEVQKLVYDKVAQDRLKTAVERHVVSNDVTYQAIERLLKNNN
jgi:glycosyltransferase involved in cell wall biosynthesis